MPTKQWRMLPNSLDSMSWGERAGPEQLRGLRSLGQCLCEGPGALGPISGYQIPVREELAHLPTVALCLPRQKAPEIR